MNLKVNKRSVGIAAAVILGIFLVFYIGGLTGQLLTNYQKWLGQNGMSGQATMDGIQLNPIKCIPFAFTLDGLKGLGLILAVTGGIILYVKLHDKFGSKNYDERNFSTSKSGTYGTAGWMDDKELESVLEKTSPKDATGTILGRQKNSVICLPHHTRLNKHMAVFGASGTMKSRGFIRPYLFQSIRRGESVIITDPKSELYNDTAELFRKNGYAVKVFNLVDPTHSDSWNCMADLQGDTLMAQVLTDVIITNTKGDNKGDHFWDNGEGNLLKALVLFVDQDSTRGLEQKHLPAVYQLLTQNSEKQLSSMFDRLPIGHPAKAPYNLFAQASDTVRAGIILGLGTRLQVLQNEAVRRITSSSDIDLTEPGKTKCAYFVILSDQDGTMDFLSSLFFSFLFIKLIRYADSRPKGCCEVPVNVVLEEGCNIGTLPGIARRLSTIRSRLVQVVWTMQSLSQLQNRYPHNEWAEILGNMDSQVMMGCTDDISADYFSMRSGDMTIEVNSTMTVRKTIAVAQVIPQYRHMEGLGRRRLLTPDEVLRLPNDELLIIIRGHKMLKANKFDFTEHPFAAEMVQTHVGNYCPQHQPENLPLPQTETQMPEKPLPIDDPGGGKLYGAATPPDGF